MARLPRFLPPLVATAAFALAIGSATPAGAGSTQPGTQNATPRLSSLGGVSTPRHKHNGTSVLEPDVRAEAAIIFSPETRRVLWEDHAHDVRPIASITKVMTALVFFEAEPDLDQAVTVARADVRRASTTYLRSGEKLTLRDALHVMLVGSDNAAARVLARSAGYGSREAFVARMNEKAMEFGLVDTTFADPSGLDVKNVSSAFDVSRLIAFGTRDERIAGIMQLPEYTFGTNRRKSVRVRNTNRLIGQLDVVGGKTGFIQRAGYCLAALLRLPDGHNVAVVVLGARSSLARFWETRHLFNWLKEHSATLAVGFSDTQ